MKLVYPGLKGQIVFDSLKASQWIVESPECLLKYILDLKQQIEGKEGEFLLIEGEMELDISKHVELIIDPFSVNINERKIINRVYTELEQLAEEGETYLETRNIWNAIQKYFFLLEQKSEYDMEMNEDIDVPAFLKAIGVQFEISGNNPFEKLNQYVKVQARLMKKKLIVFLNFQNYFTEQQLLEIVKMTNYNEIAVLFVEAHQKDFSMDVNRYIIDKDKCEIF